MIEVIALGGAFLAGVGPWRLLILSLVLWAPVALIPAVVYAAVRGKKASDDRPALFCVAVASELRAGSDLRLALTVACDSVGIDVATTGAVQPLGVAQIAGVAATALPRIGRELEATVLAVDRSGGAAADLFDELAGYAIAQTEIEHELKVATAPARATVWFFILLPLGLASFQVQRGAIAGTLAEPLQRLLALVGIVLFGSGLVAMSLLMKRAT